LNKPYREFESTVLGDPKLSAFRTAAYTARNEYARITTGTPNMGGVVSEEARNDVKKALPDTATLGQLLSSGHVAVLDMEQRKQDKINQIEYLAKNAGKGIEGLKNVSDTPDAAKLDFDTTKPIKPVTTTTPTVSNTPPPGIPPPPALPIGDGKTKLSAADKDKFLKAFNGDKDKARKAARDAKWVF
jgi:hypothetical protein